MLVDRSHEKLINTIIYFASTTEHCGKLKLFKLLYLLDFDHFAQTGQSVTGLDYHAWKYGPMPIELEQEWDRPDEGFFSLPYGNQESALDITSDIIKPKVAFDNADFTKREFRIMEQLAQTYKFNIHKQIDVGHAQNGAWEKTWNGGRGQDCRISYDLSLAESAPHRSAILAAARAHDSILRRDEALSRMAS